jgi:hypothetical protein
MITPLERPLALFACLLSFSLLAAPRAASAEANPAARIRIDPGHPWRPPFGLDRVGRPLTAVVEIYSVPSSTRAFSVTGYLDGQPLTAQPMEVPARFPSTNRITFPTWPNELVLCATNADGKALELARQAVQPPGFEADATARPNTIINPVDLGTVLVPHDWLLLAGGQSATLKMAAICRTNDLPGVLLTAWFQSRATKKFSITLDLTRNKRAEAILPLQPAPGSSDRDVLSVRMVDSAGRELWQKAIPVMLVRKAPRWPEFGATAAKLRYDAPISLLDRETGVLSSLSYSNGWPANLKDVIISFPNGSRFVFWRGASYIPFWAGRQNTGMTYEWAERPPPPEGFSDSVEPLMDKELRFGRVDILESTAARVHVRWTYQSCDFNYKVFGDAAVEDFYFYPDGIGTRVLSLRSTPEIKWELSEFIILTPQAAFPFEVLPSNLIDVLPIDGRQKQQLFFPREGPARIRAEEGSPKMPRVYRIRLHKDETAAAIYFTPNDTYRPEETGVFGPFFDQQSMVTPAYWGSHWPLGRGKTTGATIDNRIFASPAHNSLMTWASNQPEPVSVAALEMIDALGQAKPMTLRRWVWLVGMTDASDARVLEWARSFAKPPSLKLAGARLDIDSYCPDRRSMRLIVEQHTVTVRITPSVRCVNPVFELLNAPKHLVHISLADRRLLPKDYAWDGHTLWLNTDLDAPADLKLEFGNAPRCSWAVRPAMMAD